MQRRILQVTHLGNFQPWLPWHIVDDDHNESQKSRGVAPVYSTLVAVAWGIHYPISPWRSCRQPPIVGK